MVEWLQVVVLALVQGLTEFLPVSSSAHLILVSEVLGWKDQSLAFDIAVHLGTLLAVLIYFGRDLRQMIVAWLQSCYTRTLTSFAKLLWSVGFATIPVGIAGLVGKGFIETHLRSSKVIAVTTVTFGIVLWAADKLVKETRKLESLNWRDVLIIGCSQALSLIPGTSRSGITLSAGLLKGLSREAAARFSFLLSIPVIILASGLEFLSLLKSSASIQWDALSVGIGVAAISGYCCIHYFFKLLNTVGLLPFIVYRLVLGVYLMYRI